MKNEDIWIALGTVFSTIISAVTWLYQVGVLQTLFTFLTGALVTFFVQSKLQDRSEKRRLRVKAIEELHIPLFLEIENIKEFLINLERTQMGAWYELAQKPQFFTLKKELRDSLLAFFQRSRELATHLETIKRITAEIIYTDVGKFLFPSLTKKGAVRVDKKIEDLEIDKWKEGIGFGLQLKGPHFTYEAPITLCAILNHDPIDFLEKSRRAFEIEELVLFIKTIYSSNGHAAEENFHIPVTENREIFRSFWKTTIQNVQQNADVAKFNKTRLEMIPFSDDILGRLRKHIEKYVATEEI